LSGSTLDSAVRETLLADYHRVRSATESLASPITVEDAQIQSMDDVSPTKWHLGHVTWFFETFALRRDPSYVSPCDELKVLFNSYYETVGERPPRAERGLMSRPSHGEVLDYRRAVDDAMRQRLEEASDEDLEALLPILRVGLHHEQQHQELMMTDILHVYWSNPLKPAYRDADPPVARAVDPLEWCGFDGGLCRFGFDGQGFGFDNEYPRHRQFVHPFELASRVVSCGEFMEFIDDGGYERPTLWLSDGWATVGSSGWRAPMYWERREGVWWRMTHYGMQPVDPNQPVCHVSYYEADAYVRWKGARLPTELEWEHAAADASVEGNLQESDWLVPMSPTAETDGPAQIFGDVWEWTASAYLPYPGYRACEGALGEYNGKFMCNQMVLRGGSFVTPQDHLRVTYRNFFYPHSRWQFMGLRLARDVAV